jgi:hypothetical protein
MQAETVVVGVEVRQTRCTFSNPQDRPQHSDNWAKPRCKGNRNRVLVADRRGLYRASPYHGSLTTVRSYFKVWPGTTHPVNLLVERETPRRFVKLILRHEMYWAEWKLPTQGRRRQHPQT